jgi:isopenicillin N synthase-like dioxygenase
MAEPKSRRIASLKTVKLSMLLSGSEEERSILSDASIVDGFFYLDLSGLENRDFLDMVQQLFAIAEEYFEQTLQDKEKFDVHKMKLWETFG